MQKVKLGDVLDVRRGVSLPGEYYSEEGELIRLTLGNFNYPDGGFKENTTKTDVYFNGEVKDEFILNKGDIITPLTEQVAGLLGETARIPESNKYIQSGDVALIIPYEDVLDSSFAYYLISSDIIKTQLGAAAQQTKIRHTSPDKIKDCDAWLPDLQYQKKAGHLLDLIYGKIDNNNFICNKIEKISKDIYQYWFMQFDFPNNDGAPYKSSGGKMEKDKNYGYDVPEGWTVKRLKDVCETRLGGTPDTHILEYWNGDIRWLNSGEIAKSPILESEKKITERGLKESSTSFSKAGDVLLSITRYIRPSILGVDACYNQSVVAVVQNEKYHTSFLYPFLVSNIDIYMNLRTGAQQPHINKDIVDNTAIVCPPDIIMSKYYGIVEPLYSMLIARAKENMQLENMVNFLKPLLMNKQVEFND